MKVYSYAERKELIVLIANKRGSFSLWKLFKSVSNA